MKRAVPTLVVTLLGLLAIAAFKTSPGLPAKSSASPAGKSTVPPTSAPPPGTTPPTSGGSNNGTSPATNPPASGATSPPTTSSNAVRTIDGDPFDNNYGTVQVRVTLQGNRITNVTPLQMPTDRRRSAEISQQAAPLLLQEVLQAQSAQIDIIGGASYTSQSYAQSLQSALDKARA
jgi:uncharacterized protein with FMN-binding domain